MARKVSRNERKAIFVSLFLCYCCSSTMVSALLQPKSQSFPMQYSKAGSKRRRPQSHLSMSSQERSMDRREVFSRSTKALFAGLATPWFLKDPANALLLRFPIDDPSTQPLKNKYHFVRAGTSELEVEGIYSTNPLFLTNRDNAMAPQGYEDLKEALHQLKNAKSPPTVVYHSLAANGMDTGDFLARELRLGRDRLLPEFTYLDQRGIGLWDSSDASVVRPAVWAMDQLEAGSEGFGGRPPANTDGTPNDTLHDQFTRLRQFLSLQESRTAGDTILIIFPDGTGPALLSCMIAGIPYQDVHALEFQPGELRMDITPQSVRALYEERKNDPLYLEKLEEGRKSLAELRQMKAKDFSVSFKDSQANEQQLQDNKVYYEQQQEASEAKRKAEEERQKAMQEQLRLSREKARQKEEARKAEQLAIQERKAEKIRLQKEQAEKRKAEQQAAYVAKKQRLEEKAASVQQEDSASGMPPAVMGSVAVVGILGSLGAMMGGDTDDSSDPSFVSPSKIDPSGDEDVTAAIETNTTMAVVDTPAPEDNNNNTLVVADTTSDADNSVEEPDREALEGKPESSILEDPEEAFATKLQAAEQNLKDAFVEAADVQKRKQQQQPPKSSLFANDPPVTITSAPQKKTNFVFDEDDSDWLRVLGEIRDEVEDEEEDDYGMVDYASLVANTDDDIPLY